MKISSKVRNGLAAMIYMAKNYNEPSNISLLNISNNLGISKIYLEQAFLLLKRDGLVVSTKGPKGGYALSKEPSETCIYSIITALDGSIFEKTADTVSDYSKALEKTMQESIFDVLDKSIEDSLKNISLQNVVDDLNKNEIDNSCYMYYL